LILDSLQPTGVSPESTKKDAPFLPHMARTCEPLPLDVDETGSGASEPPPDGLEGVPLELGETGAVGDGEGSGVGVGVVPEGALGVAGGVASGVPPPVGVVAGGVVSIVPDGVPGVAGEVTSGIPPPVGGVAGVLGGVTGEDVGEVGVVSMGCA
jgi:hypothetical protein